MPIISQVRSLAKIKFASSPAKRKCPLCHKFGAHCHGLYYRAPPGRISYRKDEALRIPRFLCLSCLRTFSILLFCLVRRVGIPLICLLALAQSQLTWAKLEEIFEISRSTLWRWRRLARQLIAAISRIPFETIHSWPTFSALISHVQYPLDLRNQHPTIPGE